MVSQLCTTRGGGLKLPSSQAGGAFGGARRSRVVGGQGSFPCEQRCKWLGVGLGEQGSPRRGGHPGVPADGCHLARTLRPTEAWRPAPTAVPLTQPLG